ncbi:MAG: YggS family pyridoxal phosphate-dependent enzyme [Alphaproteobacteria bacterium]|jgi:PLP dependent protein|nr:YggS family pyridoxal phosphate-dependent enzyme [Alphaproteobacteria bacterium]MBT4711324.1 YggS family pyridoxal phosphate-dependent enzyme [Alphaproteobacteria bacterium]MBT5859968.1 YggS family pyridoxal phosphate-dependent enzyme [Alphaproteobacteria bacterium]
MTSSEKPDETVVNNLSEIQQRISAAEQGRSIPGSPVELVAVSKMHGMDRIQNALDAGHRVFGENRVQEAQKKWTGQRSKYPDLSLHLIGPLQTNKAADAVDLFDVIQTVDRPKLARALAKHIHASPRNPTCMIQVNIGDEAQKAGVAISDLGDLLNQCRGDIGLPIIGLMCIPPAAESPAPYFALMAKLAAAQGLEHLSMGMTGDFEDAIKFGATSVRVGTGIFGPRPGPVDPT